MKKATHVIGIDPDVDKNGVAILDVASRKIDLYSLEFPELVERIYEEIKARTADDSLLIAVEAGWLNRSNWHWKYGDSPAKISAIGKDQGRNEQASKHIIAMSEWYVRMFDKDVTVLPVAPLRKCWTGKNKKITHDELTQFMEINKKRTNQEERDAAMIAWVHSGLPIRIKPTR